MNGVTSAASAAASVSSSAAKKDSRTTIAENFDAFLSLLTTQLKNQNPLEPLDANQFTQQLVQFAGVEQQIKTNDSLTALLAANRTATVTNALGFVGAKIVADGATTRLSNGRAEWKLNAPRGAAATITISDKSGNVVQTDTRTLNAGDQAYIWNGRTSNGTLAPEGEYKLTIAALDAAGQQVTVRSEVTGTVDSVDLSGDELLLRIGSIQIPASQVKSIQR